MIRTTPNIHTVAALADPALTNDPPDSYLVVDTRFTGVSKEWIEGQLVVIARDAMQITRRADGSKVKHTERLNPTLAVSTLLAIAKLKGYIVERKQVDQRNVKADLGKVSRAELSQLLGNHLKDLDPAARARILAMAEAPADATYIEVESSDPGEP